MSTHPSSERAALEGPWLASNATAFAVVGPEAGTLLISTRQAAARWSALSPDERGDVLALVDALGGGGGRVECELDAPPDVRWHLRLRRPAGTFASLPGFVAGEEQHLLPALRAALARADEVDLLAAFVQRSGVRLLRDDLEDALRRGARVRILTGDYLGLTAVDALRDLDAMTEEFAGLQVAVHQCEGATSFHPKAYIFRSGAASVAYVGSSNLSRSALTSGVEWNLRAIDDAHGRELTAIRARFSRLWDAPQTVPLTAAWITAYAARVPVAREWDPPEPPPTPHGIQREALAALARAWAADARRGLVVLATGLGKTLLAAFAAQQMGARRVLFVAHRGEILTQARRAFERVLPTRSTGLFQGPRRDGAADLLFASVQTLARPEHLATWPRDHFDLIVIDEFHHAAAASYRRILQRFTPRFLLGITATPERGDGAALLDLCDDNLVFRADLARGITCGRLVPFAYHGLCDSVDYQAIPWRSGRFDPAALSRALATISHAEQALAGYRAHAPMSPRRGLWFCASIAHAEFMAKFLADRGVPAVAVHSEQGGAPRGESLRRLMAGELEAITTVDVFNEGVDAPDINVVVLLRPTESRVIFLQQIGRGLRLPVFHEAREFLRDTWFSSPSAAAAVVWGRSANGRMSWRVQDSGQTFAEWEEGVPAGESDEDEGEDDAREDLYRRFWDQFLAKANARGTLFQRRTRSANPWLGVGLGRNGFRLNVAMTRSEARVTCLIHQEEGGTALFDVLHTQRAAIEAEFGAPLDWAALSERKRSRIRATTAGGWLLPETNWPEIQDRLLDLAYRMDAVLRPRIELL